MSAHGAIIEWTRGDQPFVDKRYSRLHRWTFDGGQIVPGSSAPAAAPVPMSDPSAVGPEEAMIASLSSCHMLWFLDIASRAGLRVNRYTDAAVGTMAQDEQGRLVVTQVQLRPVTRFDAAHAPSAAQLQDLHHQAHAACFLANSVKTRIDCAPVLEVEGA